MLPKIKQHTKSFLKSKEPLGTPATQVLTNLEEAIRLHQQGKIHQAESIYRQLLEKNPKNSDALH